MGCLPLNSGKHPCLNLNYSFFIQCPENWVHIISAGALLVYRNKKYKLFNMPKPLPLGEVSLQSNDGEGKPGEAEPLHSDRQTLCQSETIAASMSLCQHPCPLSAPRQTPLFVRFATSSGRGKSFLKGRAFSGGIIRSSLPPPPHGSPARRSSRCRRRRGQG